ncbi:hypothetical protein BJ508DRAFT_182309 [Ascobolus immersus RN42]|uniref:Transmembrane protein n=1 Tax=Ascobolus immersus RN42 TaxID=1160509 RepID=A0A3N4HXB3_ASCIM|nr:hypothetical protein BJ508DRAFT_182309 [Ascobolus immersus RN42]
MRLDLEREPSRIPPSALRSLMLLSIFAVLYFASPVLENWYKEPTYLLLSIIIATHSNSNHNNSNKPSQQTSSSQFSNQLLEPSKLYSSQPAFKMKSFGIISFFLFFFTFASVLATPVAVPASDLITRAEKVELDTIIKACISEVKVVDAKYNATCSKSCGPTQITNWSKEISVICYKYVDICKTKLPAGYKWKGLVTIIVELVVALLIEINFTLKFLVSKAGLLGIVAGLLNLVAVLIAGLNALLACLALYVPGLLALVGKLLISVLGLVGCLLCNLGLLLI